MVIIVIPECVAVSKENNAEFIILESICID